MTDYVVDASVAAKWFLPEEHLAEARRLLNEENRLLGPQFILVEAGNIFLKKVRRGELDVPSADEYLTTIAVSLEFRDDARLISQTLPLALQYNRSFYDALYVALALDEGCQLVTADERMFNALSGSLPETMVWVGNLQAS